MTRLSLILACAGSVAVVSAQTSPPGSTIRPSTPVFEVVSVRPQTTPVTVDEVIAWARPQPGGRLAGTHSTIEQLIRFAYDVTSFQMTGAPAWIREEYFDLDARAATPVSLRQLRLMTQALLEDRFKLVTHWEQREMRYLALVLARPDRQPGPNLHRIEEDACLGRTVAAVHLEKFPEARTRRLAGGGTIAGACYDLGVLAEGITFSLGTLVVDRTGLTGLWVYDAPHAGLPPPPMGSPRLGAPLPVASVPGLASYTEALEQHLGLKLESARGPVDVLVIDAVERPTPN